MTGPRYEPLLIAARAEQHERESERLLRAEQVPSTCPACRRRSNPKGPEGALMHASEPPTRAPNEQSPNESPQRAEPQREPQ